jgi:SAM-dependent methyltransferase
MNRHTHTIPASYFERLYEVEQDPWNFETSAYEHSKYGATIAALTRLHYRRGLEVGCSIGVFTALLAHRCEHLLAIDVSHRALNVATERCRGFANVKFEKRNVPADWPRGAFDLIVLSEIIYYLDPADVSGLADRVRGSVDPGGQVLLVHWLGSTDYPLTGDDAAELFMRALGRSVHRFRHVRTEAYRLDSLAVV